MVHKFLGKVINKEVYLLKKVLILLGPKIEVGNCHPCSNQSDFLICSRNGGRSNNLSGEVVNNMRSLLLRPILGKGGRANIHWHCSGLLQVSRKHAYLSILVSKLPIRTDLDFYSKFNKQKMEKSKSKHNHDRINLDSKIC